MISKKGRKGTERDGKDGKDTQPLPSLLNKTLRNLAITSSEQLFRECGFDDSLPDQKRAISMHPLPHGLPTEENGL